MSTANTATTLSSTLKESYANGEKRRKKSKGRFGRLRDKLLKDWKPKKVGM